MRVRCSVFCSALLACSVFPEQAVLPQQAGGSGGDGGSAGRSMGGAGAARGGTSGAAAAGVAGSAGMSEPVEAGAGGAMDMGGGGAMEAGGGGAMITGGVGGTRGGRDPGAGEGGEATAGAAGAAAGGRGGAPSCPGAVEHELAPVADAFVVETEPKGNFGALQTLEVGTLVGEVTNSLVRFDLTSLMGQGAVASAELSLTLRTSPGEARSLGAHRIAQDWTERRVNWTEATPSSDWATLGGNAERSPTAVASITVATPVGEQIVWDLTQDVQADLARGTSFGWLLKEARPGLGRVEFASREASSDAPRLTVVTCP